MYRRQATQWSITVSSGQCRVLLSVRHRYIDIRPLSSAGIAKCWPTWFHAWFTVNNIRDLFIDCVVSRFASDIDNGPDFRENAEKGALNLALGARIDVVQSPEDRPHLRHAKPYTSRFSPSFNASIPVPCPPVIPTTT